MMRVFKLMVFKKGGKNMNKLVNYIKNRISYWICYSDQKDYGRAKDKKCNTHLGSDCLDCPYKRKW